MTGRAVIIDGGRIACDLPTEEEVPAGAEAFDLGGNTLVPGFIDTQVNGGGDRLFNDDPSVETIAAIGSAHRRFGTTGFLPTLISDDAGKIAAAIDAARMAIAAGVPGVLGVHIEGPFLNPAKKGIHDATKLRPISDSDIELLTSRSGGKTDRDACARSGARRSDPPPRRGRRDRLRRPHAGERRRDIRGAPQRPSRLHPPVQRDVAADRARARRRRRGAATTRTAGAGSSSTAITSIRASSRSRCGQRRTGGSCSSPTRCRASAAASRSCSTARQISAVDGKCVNAQGTLAGSDLDMASAVRNAVAMLGLDLADAVAMASANPAAFLGLDHELGRIAPGYRANLVLLDAALAGRRHLDRRGARRRALGADRVQLAPNSPARVGSFTPFSCASFQSATAAAASERFV